MTVTASFDSRTDLGYSDAELERLSELRGFGDSWWVPWATWESEHAGYGRAFRSLARYPAWLPLFFMCDHGVFLSSKCWENELESPYRMHFTSLRRKREVLRERHGRRAHHVTHPWVDYRRRHFPTPPAERRGTLVFFPHSNATAAPVFDVDRYVEELKALPEEFQPVAICLSFHDVHAGVHRALRGYGLPLVTAGHANSRHFIDRFYSLVYRFRYASSPNIGSHTFYIMEAGVPFFLYGEYPRIRISNSRHAADGVYGEEIRGGDEEEAWQRDAFIDLLYTRGERVTAEQMAGVSHYLGLDSELSRAAMSRLIWREAFSLRNWRTYLGSLTGRVRGRVAASR